MSISVSSTIRSYPRLPYDQILKDVLGPQYSLSLVFVGTTRATTLNKLYRKKTYAPNILSFPLTDSAGEIYIAPTIAKKEAARRNMTLQKYVGYLFIHGLLHLKGHLHGDTMEKAEKKYMSKYFG